MSDLKSDVGGTSPPQAAPEAAPEAVTEAAASRAELAVAPEIVANSLGEYLRAWASRIRAGESGVLPLIIGIVVIAVIFQSQNANFLTAGNLVNLIAQGAPIMLLGLAQVFALVLGEIDLSIGYVGGVAGAIVAELLAFPRNWPWYAAVALALVVSAVIGFLQGTVITRLRLPSFVSPSPGSSSFRACCSKCWGRGGPCPSPATSSRPGKREHDRGGGLGGGGVADPRLRRRHLAAGPPPPGQRPRRPAGGPHRAEDHRGGGGRCGARPHLQCQPRPARADPGRALGRADRARRPRGLVGAVGQDPVRTLRVCHRGNAEAARRAGVNLVRIRTTAFILCSLTAGIAGVVYASRLRSVSTNLDGGTLVLYAVAAAVIGGTSLFGGRGKPLHAVLGGIVIAAIANGMGLLGMAAATQLMVTALVLLAAVTIDAVARRGRTVAGTR